MPARSDLVERSGDLKRDLVDFALQRRFARDLDRMVERDLGDVVIDSEADFTRVVDRFALQHRLSDGRTVVEIFVAEHPELSEEERALLLGWRDVVDGIFEIERRDGDALIATNLIDELTYRVRSNMGPTALRPMAPGSFLLTRLVPIADEWLLSGMSSLYPASDREAVHELAAEIAATSPALVFRNPDKLAQGWELQRKERESFVDFFGADLVVLAGHELVERMQAFMHFRTHEVRDAEGKSIADRARAEYGTEPPAVDLQLPPDLTEAETVGVIYDELDGLNFYRDFALLEAAFANPELASKRRHRQALLGYLKEPSVSPLPFHRLAERSPERASRVFAQLLKRPGFSWERDGDALLRHYKASYFEKPVLPSVTPISRTLARAKLASREQDEAAAPGRPRRPKPVSGSRARRRSRRSR
jgi:hypothetical protein